jgi:hypothetical protein
MLAAAAGSIRQASFLRLPFWNVSDSDARKIDHDNHDSNGRKISVQIPKEWRQPMAANGRVE